MYRETDLGTTVFWSEEHGIGEIEFDCISHFYPESEWYPVIDFWGKTGLCIGYRDKVYSQQTGYKDHGFGGEFYILYDHDNSIGGIHPSKMTAL